MYIYIYTHHVCYIYRHISPECTYIGCDGFVKTTYIHWDTHPLRSMVVDHFQDVSGIVIPFENCRAFFDLTGAVRAFYVGLLDGLLDGLLE